MTKLEQSNPGKHYPSHPLQILKAPAIIRSLSSTISMKLTQLPKDHPDILSFRELELTEYRIHNGVFILENSSTEYVAISMSPQSI